MKVVVMTMDEEQVTEWVKAQREQASVPTPPRKQTVPKKYVTRQDETGVGEWPAARREPIPTTCPRCSRALIGTTRWCMVHGDQVDTGAVPFVEEVRETKYATGTFTPEALRPRKRKTKWED